MLITMHSLDHMREHFIQLAHANSTQANMLSHRKSYITFCTNYKLTPFPIHALTAARYIVALAHAGRTFGTIQNHLSSLKHFHQISGFSLGWETDYLLRLTLNGAKRYLSMATNRKLPITPVLLRDMASLFKLDNPLHAAMWALFLVAFFSFLRKSNLVVSDSKCLSKVVRFNDLTFTANGANLQISETKTIQFSQRILTVPLPVIPGSVLCPIAALRNHIVINNISHRDFLFSLRKGKSAKATPITYHQFNSFLKKSLSAIGKNPASFATHSFRRGGATFAFDCGLPAELIKSQGDWLSDAYQLYLEMSDTQKQRAVSIIAHNFANFQF